MAISKDEGFFEVELKMPENGRLLAYVDFNNDK
jgi:hypothetical protein